MVPAPRIVGHRAPGGYHLLLALLVVLAGGSAPGLLAAAPQEDPDTGEPAGEPPPFDIGLHEEAGVSILLLDVEVTDRQGRPVRGLGLEDFHVWERLKEWEILSVDDLCRCPDATVGPGPDRPFDVVSDATAAQPATGAAMADRPPGRLFVMYFEFSQLDSDGRVRALDRASRWIREAMTDQDRLLMAGYASAAGLRLIAPPSSQRDDLLQRLQAAFDDQELLDTFPGFRRSRLMLCKMDAEFCGDYAWEEYLHGRRTLRAFQRFITGLELIEGRKQLFYFTQNGGMYPYQLFASGGPDLSRQVEEIAAEATSSRAVIHTVNTGLPSLMEPSAEMVVSMGWHLGEYTGGRYNRAPKDLYPMLEQVANRCACTYRIGLRPLQEERSVVHAVRVEAAGRILPHRYRIQFLTPLDRAFRTFLVYLQDPDTADAFPMQVSLRPVGVRRSAWDVALQIRFDPRHLHQAPGPSSGKEAAGWDVGGLLFETGGKADWEFFGSVAATGRKGGLGQVVALHDGRVDRLRAGEYSFRALVRDRTANTFAGSQTTLALPRPQEASILGPFCLEAAPALRSPLLETGRAGPQAHRGKIELSTLPCAGPASPPGSLLLMQTWLCPGKGEPAPDRLQGVISRAGTPVYRLWPAVVTPSGPCVQASDAIDTTRLDAGRYRYQLLRDQEPVGHLAFTVAPAGEMANP